MIQAQAFDKGETMNSYGVNTGSNIDTVAMEVALKQAAAQSAFDKSRSAELIERAPTLTDLVGLSDQLAAAVQDVADAWIGFQQGKNALQDVPASRAEVPHSTYRIDRLHAEMHEQIAALQRIANDIRGRA